MKLFLAQIWVVVILFLLCSKNFAQNTAMDYVCMPCGSSCDTKVYDKEGICNHCGMTLVDKKTVIFKEISPLQLCELVEKNPNIIILDVRTSDEFKGKANVNSYGHLNNAINIPIQELENRLKELEKFKDKEIIVYCSHSRRSPRASYLLSIKGFVNVKNMSGGMSIWKDAVKDVTGSEGLFIEHE